MAKVISDLTARSKFDQILRRTVKEHARFVIEKEGKPQVVLLGIREYIKTAAPEPEILRIIGEESEQKGTNKLTLHEIDAEIKAYRREKRSKNGSA
jgi:prevent-host-death family protein